MTSRAVWFILIIATAIVGGNLLRAVWEHARPHTPNHAITSKQDWSEFPEVKPSSPNDPWKDFPEVQPQK